METVEGRKKRVRRDQPTTFCSIGARGVGPIKITIDGVLAERLRDLHEVSRGSSIQQWCVEALESWVMDHRSNKPPADESRYWDRNGCDADHVADY